MVLLAAVVLAVGIGLVQLFGGDDEPAATQDETTSQVGPSGQVPGGGAAPQGQPVPPPLPGEGREGADPQAPGAPGVPAGPAGQPPAEAPADEPAPAGPAVTS